MALPWPRLLTACRTGDDVVFVARNYLSSWTQARLALLPDGAAPPSISTRDSVATYALVLVRLQLRSQTCNEQLDVMASFFARPPYRLPSLSHVFWLPTR